jgi:ATPase subunit of ABC transporter with duplicated ATPase domains
MIEIALNGVEKYYGAIKVLDNITFEIQRGQRVGIIGRNGTGKSTIMKIIAGIEKHDRGMVSIRKGASIGYLDQIPRYPDGFSVLDVLDSAFEKQNEIRRSMESLEAEMQSLEGSSLDTAVKRYGELLQSYEHSGGYEIQEKIDRICMGLKFHGEFKSRRFSTLSGGEKTTVVLGKILLQSPDILLLDEPSNHLDLESVEWLEEYLSAYKGTVAIVSHDRYFLDRTVTGIIEIEDGRAVCYAGGYSDYALQKETNYNLQLDAYKDQQKKINAMEKAIRDLRDWAARADNPKFFKRAESMQKRLDKMEKIEKPVLEGPSCMNFMDSDRSGKDAITIKDLKKSFGGRVILDGANLHIRYGEKVALIGTNGSGKSTLLKILLKEYAADEGTANLGSGVKAGYLPQEVVFEHEDFTLLECFREDISITEGKAREYLARFKFCGESVFKKVRNLSGGEKSRLRLCRLMFDESNLLILDEPTNHLDISSREALENTLLEFEGTILFISHDRYFINTLCDRLVELKEGHLTGYEGNYEYYRAKREEERAVKKVYKETQGREEKQRKSEQSGKGQPGRNREASLKDIEEAITDMERSIKGIEARMEECQGDYEALSGLYSDKVRLQQELDVLMEDWMGLSV